MLWGQFKDRLFDTRVDTLKNLGRFVKLRFNDTDCYMTKLDLIDTHPNLFITDKDKLNKREREYLRIFVNGTRVLYKCKRPL